MNEIVAVLFSVFLILGIRAFLAAHSEVKRIGAEREQLEQERLQAKRDMDELLAHGDDMLRDLQQ